MLTVCKDTNRKISESDMREKERHEVRGALMGLYGVIFEKVDVYSKLIPRKC